MTAADQEFPASFAAEIGESGVSRLQQVPEENRDLPEEVASAFRTGVFGSTSSGTGSAPRTTCRADPGEKGKRSPGC